VRDDRVSHVTRRTIEEDIEQANTTIASLLQQLDDHMKTAPDTVTGKPTFYFFCTVLTLA